MNILLNCLIFYSNVITSYFLHYSHVNYFPMFQIYPLSLLRTEYTTLPLCQALAQSHDRFIQDISIGNTRLKYSALRNPNHLEK